MRLLAAPDAELMLGSLIGDFVRGRIDPALPPRRARRHRAASRDRCVHRCARRTSRPRARCSRRRSGVMPASCSTSGSIICSRGNGRDSAKARSSDFSRSRARSARFECATCVPERMRGFVAYLDAHDLPAAYRDVAMIGDVLRGMSRRLVARESARRRAAGAGRAARAAAAVFRGVLSGAAAVSPSSSAMRAATELRRVETKTPPAGGVSISGRVRRDHFTWSTIQ